MGYPAEILYKSINDLFNQASGKDLPDFVRVSSIPIISNTMAKERIDAMKPFKLVLQNCVTWIEGDNAPESGRKLQFGESVALDLLRDALESMDVHATIEDKSGLALLDLAVVVDQFYQDMQTKEYTGLMFVSNNYNTPQLYVDTIGNAFKALPDNVKSMIAERRKMLMEQADKK